MIEESGRVVALEDGAVWVETRRSSTCSACSANAGCGQGLLDRLGVGQRRARVRALTDLRLAVGDGVTIGIREEQLLRSSLQVYLLPLLGLFAAALLAERWALGEPVVILAALGGFSPCGGWCVGIIAGGATIRSCSRWCCGPVRPPASWR